VTSLDVASWRCANSSLCFFWFSDDPTPYSVCDPSQFPPSVSPVNFTLFLDFNKNHTTGDSGPRSMSRAPSSSSFCCLQLLFDFLCQYPPLPGSALLSGSTTPLTPALIRSVFSATAVALQLDPRRLVPHSLRGAALCMMLARTGFTDLDHLAQGRWASTDGLRPYAHTSLAHADRVTPALYDETTHPIAQVRLHYSAAIY
jgi:hypothetical protein